MSLLNTQKVLVPAISCHAWNADRTRVAICPSNEKICIYKTNNSEDFEKWELEHTLVEHDHYVTAIDWAPKSNKILSCSQDRNAYVWEYSTKTNKWEPTLVLVRITKAATCCKWSPNEDKFAVGSAAKMVSVCFYEAANKWYISKMIKKHKSTVKAVAWHPTDNTLLATGSSDMKARTFNAYIKDVDGKATNKLKFGDCLVEYTSKGWVHDVQFSPTGKWLAFIGHDSTVQFVDYASQDQSQADSTPVETQIVRHDKLPFYRGLFLSDKAFVAVGYDFAPYAFALDGNKWVCKGSCDEGKKATSAGAGGAGVRSAFLKFQATSTVGAANAEKDDAPTTRHHNVITSIQSFKVDGGKVSKFTTSGLDGKLLFWNVSDLQKNLSLTL